MAKDNQSQEEIVLKLSTDSGETAKVTTVTAAMNGLDALLKEIHEECDKNYEFLLKARPFEKGSFEIPLELILIGALGLNWPIIQDMLKILSEYLKIRKLLRGEESKIEGGYLIIRNSKIKVEKVTINLLQKPRKTATAISNAFRTLKDDSDVTGLSIIQSHKKKPLIQIKDRQFPYYKESCLIETIPKERTETRREILSIVVSVLDVTPEGQKWKWRLSWQGMDITAKIIDQEFLNKIEGGEPFSNGDKLDADLVIHQRYEESIKDFKNVEYTITKIWKHIPREQQGELFV